MTTEFDVSNFDALRISLADAEDVRSWSRGEVKKTQDDQLPHPQARDATACSASRSSAPRRDWECACGKYKRVRYKGIVCEQLRRRGHALASVRRERMGHIDLAAPVTPHLVLQGRRPRAWATCSDLAPEGASEKVHLLRMPPSSPRSTKEVATRTPAELRAELEPPTSRSWTPSATASWTATRKLSRATTCPDRTTPRRRRATRTSASTAEARSTRRSPTSTTEFNERSRRCAGSAFDDLHEDRAEAA